MKYSLLKSKTTGERVIRINATGEKVREGENPTEYARLRKLALKNIKQGQHDQLMKDVGLVKVRGAVSGKVYWE